MEKKEGLNILRGEDALKALRQIGIESEYIRKHPLGYEPEVVDRVMKKYPTPEALFEFLNKAKKAKD